MPRVPGTLEASPNVWVIPTLVAVGVVIVTFLTVLIGRLIWSHRNDRKRSRSERIQDALFDALVVAGIAAFLGLFIATCATAELNARSSSDNTARAHHSWDTQTVTYFDERYGVTIDPDDASTLRHGKTLIVQQDDHTYRVHMENAANHTVAFLTSDGTTLKETR